MTLIPNPIESSAVARPDHPALLWGEGDAGRWVYRELREQVRLRAGVLAEAGVGEGDLVALMGEPGPEWVAAFHAVGWVGATVMPLSGQTSSVESTRIFRGLCPDFVWRDSTCLAPEGLLGIPSADFMSARSSLRPEEVMWGLLDTRVVMHTSGTTGHPRAVHLTTGQLVFSAMGSSIRLGHHLDDVWGNSLPLHHMGGLSILIRCGLLGTTVRLSYPFNPASTNLLIDQGRVTQLSVVPAMLEALLEQRGDREFPASLRVLLTGGARCEPALLKRAEAVRAPVSLTWGMTESASQVATRFPGDYRDGIGSGPPQPFARVGGGNPCLSILGPLVGGGSMLSADQGRVDSAGNVHVHRRGDRIIVSGGENLDPVEIEAFVGGLGGVAEAAVVEVPHRKWGQRPVAFVVGDASGSLGAYPLLKERCRKGLGAVKAPDQFFLLGELPRTSLGKVALGQLRALARAVLVGQEPQSLEIGAELLGHSAGGEGFEVDNGVDEFRGSANALVGPLHGVEEGDGAGAYGANGELDGESVSQAHGGAEVRLGVNQGHRPAPTLQDGAQAVRGGHEHLLKGGVAIFEDSAEKCDPGSVNLVESDGDGMFETHNNSNASLRGTLSKTNS